MELRVLGPLEASVNGTALPLGTRKQQAVLALLAVHANQVVGMESFVDELWHNQAPPPSAMSNVRGYVGNLRRLFGSSEPLNDRISRRGVGYLFRAEPDELDLLAFENENRDGRTAADRADLAIAAKLFTDATARWRGHMLAGLDRGPILAARCVAVEAQRLTLIEQLTEVHLALGEPDRAVPAMYEHVLAHPLRERAHALLIQALQQAGDAGAALSAYATARTILAEELGIEPGPELQQLHHAVLNREPTRRAPQLTAAVAAVRAKATAPRELPADVGYFVGRQVEAQRVIEALSSGGRPDRRRPAVAILCGTGGVGKSALAVRVGHKIIDSYPDGQLYVDLLGSTPGLRPRTPVEVMRRLLRSVGTPKEEIPEEEADAEVRLRSVMAGGRYLLVLDNATGTSQVRPLLPASDTCGVIITCRQPLAALDADVHLRLDTLPSADGLELLRHTSGDVAIESGTAEAIVDLCGRLPLALRIAGGRLLSRPDLSPAELARRLADRERRLDELELEGVAVRSCIRVGYEAQTSGAARADQLAGRAFRALGLLNVPDVQPAVVAAMLAEPRPDVAGALDHLVSAQLLAATAGRYGMHDLVRLVAAELAVEEDEPTARVSMLRRVMVYYGATAQRAGEILRPGRSLGPAGFVAPSDVLTTELGTPTQARSWLDDELPNIVAAAEQASVVDLEGGNSHLTLWLICATEHSLWERNDWRLRQRMATLALHAEEANLDQETAGWAYLVVGQAEFDLGNRDLAVEHFEHGLVILRRAGSVKGVALTLNSLAIAASTPLNDPGSAVAHFDECLEHARLHRLGAQEALILGNRGNLKATLGWWEDARRDLEESLSLSRARGDPTMMGSSGGLLAAVCCAVGDPGTAAEYARDAEASCREAGDRRRECHALLIAAEIHLRDGDDGDHDEAARQARAALSLAHECRYAYAEAAALRQYAKAAAAAGQLTKAKELRAEAAVAFANLSTPPDPVLEAILAPTTLAHAPSA